VRIVWQFIAIDRVLALITYNSVNNLPPQANSYVRIFYAVEIFSQKKQNRQIVYDEGAHLPGWRFLNLSVLGVERCHALRGNRRSFLAVTITRN
jgi:hypothetical protein